jgi:hypothetical protein
MKYIFLNLAALSLLCLVFGYFGYKDHQKQQDIISQLQNEINLKHQLSQDKNEPQYDKFGYELVSVCDYEPSTSLIFQKPKLNEIYYSISSTGEIEKTTWKNDTGDQYRLKTNNVFLHEEDAEQRALELFK